MEKGRKGVQEARSSSVGVWSKLDICLSYAAA